MYYWGFDLGDGESAIARVSEDRMKMPEIMEVEGNKVFITAWALMKNGEVRIGENAAKAASAALRSAVRFKSRFLNAGADCNGLIRDFSARALESLRAGRKLVGGETENRFYIGCPAGWDAAARERYRTIFETLGCPAPHIVSESRAVMVGSVQSNSLSDYVDYRTKSVLVIDIGSSTTDFAYIHKGKESEISTGGEVYLGGGIMDELLLERCIAASPNAAALRRVFAESPSWRVDCELHARKLKERYYSTAPEKRDPEAFVDSLLVHYDEPLLLNLFMDEDMSNRLTDRPCAALGGRSFHEAFRQGLQTVRQSIGDEMPELLFLTGGVSKMEAVRGWCAEVFPEAVIYNDSEPEFSVARGLAWCGRVDEELSRFRAEVDELIRADTIESIVSGHLKDLYRSALDQLLDPMMEQAVKPVLIDWRAGTIEKISDLAPALQDKVRTFLYSEKAKDLLYKIVEDWLYLVSADLEKITSPICRRYHVPDHSLKITSAIAASDFHVLEQLKAEDIFAGDALRGAAVLVEAIVSVLVALLCGGSGVALIAEGPVGLATGFIASILLLAVGHIMGKKAIDQTLMDANLPLFVRRAALSKPLPKLERTEISIPNPVKLLQNRERADGDGENRKAQDRLGIHLLPRLVPVDDKAIAAGRMRRIRNKVYSSYTKLMEDENSEEVKALNETMCSEISHQIDKCLKALAEQVEIPL